MISAPLRVPDISPRSWIRRDSPSWELGGITTTQLAGMRVGWAPSQGVSRRENLKVRSPPAVSSARDSHKGIMRSRSVCVEFQHSNETSSFSTPLQNRSRAANSSSPGHAPGLPACSPPSALRCRVRRLPEPFLEGGTGGIQVYLQSEPTGIKTLTIAGRRRRPFSM